jgi:hypothetical protein
MSTADGYHFWTYGPIGTFSLPPASPLKEIPSSEVLAKITNGTDVGYNHIIIKGDLDLRQLHSPTSQVKNENYTLLSSLSIEDSIIEGDIISGNTLFMKPVNFQNTRFNGSVDIPSSKFIKDANFANCKFEKYAYFDSSDFKKNASFNGVMFGEAARFDDSKFEKKSDFTGSNFTGSADFRESIFYGDANFLYSNFNKDSNFDGSQFKKDVNFGDSIFSRSNRYVDLRLGGHNVVGYAGFDDSNFSGYADFSRCDFGEADFVSSNFRQAADFSGSRFNKDAYFGSSKFSKGADFNMAQFKENTSFEGTEFLGFLNLTGVTFNNLDFNWPSGTILICSDGLTYLNLIRNFRDLEHFELADEIYYQYRKWRQDQTSWSDGNKYIDLLSWLSCGYGVRPQYPLYWSGILILAFGIVYWIFEAVQRSNWQYYRISYAAEYKKSRSLSLNKFCLDLLKRIRERFSTGSSLSFSDAVYFSSMIFFVSHPPTDWRPSDSWRWWKYVIMIEDILGWLLLTLFVVTLTHVMIRP